jgi:hypothetical protein
MKLDDYEPLNIDTPGRLIAVCPQCSAEHKLPNAVESIRAILRLMPTNDAREAALHSLGFCLRCGRERSGVCHCDNVEGMTR